MLSAAVLASILLYRADPISDVLVQIRRFDESPPYRQISLSVHDLPNGAGKLIQIQEKVGRDIPSQAVGYPVPPTHFDTFFEQLAALSPGGTPSIPWQDLAAEGDVATRDLGLSGGFHWIARSTLPFAMQAKRCLQAQGGEELRAMAEAGVTGRTDPWTRSQVDSVLTKPEFEPVVLEELQRHDPKTYGDFLSFLQYDFDSKADAELIHAFWHGEARTRTSAAWTLISNPPYRRAAETAYLDMIRRGPFAGEAARIAGQLGMAEALPDLDRLWKTSTDFQIADSAYRSAQTLRHGTDSGALKAAYDRLVSGQGMPADLRTLRHGDPVEATFLAIEGTARITKGGPYPPTFRAMHLLYRLNTKTSRSFVARFNLHRRLEWLAEREH